MTREIELTLLVDNEAFEGLVVEHGFAAWITVGAEHILYDTGAGAALRPNAASLGIDLSQADILVLSHGHYDHTGGIADFLAINPTAKLYAAPSASVSRYSCHPDTSPRMIGVNARNQVALQNLPGSRFHEVHTPLRLMDGIGLTGPIPRCCPFEDTGGPFFLDALKQQTDMIEDDQALWFETTGGLVIALGCCHAGIVNTVDYIRKLSGIRQIRGIIGGLHLLNASSFRLENTLRALQDWPLEFLIPCHCTGANAVSKLREVLGSEVVKSACAGMTFPLGRLK